MKTGGGTENCHTITEVGTLGFLLIVLREGLELAKVTAAELEVLLECGGFHCIFKAEGLVWHYLGPLLTGGGANGNMSISNEVVRKVSGFLCPETSHLTTTQVPLTAIYLAK
jgi:hypothetical protein